VNERRVVRDVVVVGASQVGLLTAIGLARAGLDVEVIDSVPPQRLPWTAVHHWSVLAGLDRLGVLDPVLDEGVRTSQWGLHVLATGEQLTYDVTELADSVRFPFNVRLETSLLCAVLARAFLAHPGATISPRTRVRGLVPHDTGVLLELDDDVGGPGRILEARWVVAADGLSSVVRRELGLGFEGTTWPERSVTALVEHDFAAHGYPDTTFQVDGRLGAVVERAGDRRWRYVYEEPLHLPEESIGERLPGVLEQATGERPRVLDWTSSRMHQRTAVSYRSGRVLLVGEAAHVTHRLVGRAPISGYFDAFSVVPALAQVVRGRSYDHVLSRWADHRRRVFLDEVVPTTASRKNLVTQIRDPHRREIELDHYRRALTDPVARREVLLQGTELDAGAPLGEPLPG
jgi:3-(3-hydroxy-phenyl)propionate hydroxylase